MHQQKSWKVSILIRVPKRIMNQIRQIGLNAIHGSISFASEIRLDMDISVLGKSDDLTPPYLLSSASRTLAASAWIENGF